MTITAAAEPGAKAVHPFFKPYATGVRNKRGAGDEEVDEGAAKKVKKAETVQLERVGSTVSTAASSVGPPCCADDRDGGASQGEETDDASRSEAASEDSDDDDGAVEELWSALTDPSWRHALEPETRKPYFRELAGFVRRERRKHTVYPPPEHVFAAFNNTPIASVKAVVIGQDPYHGEDQAHGLCFSVRRGVRTPPSLKNIFKELASDVEGFTIPDHGCLEAWAGRGVLLLNATLTVKAKCANSHAKAGWQTFTDAAIHILSERREGLVFLLWGGFAQKRAKVVANPDTHRVLKTFHPSPLSVTKWRGCRVFTRANAALKELGKEPIDWSVPLDAGGGGGEKQKGLKCV